MIVFVRSYEFIVEIDWYVLQKFSHHSWFPHENIAFTTLLYFTTQISVTHAVIRHTVFSM
jgi:hypothetical protein